MKSITYDDTLYQIMPKESTPEQRIVMEDAFYEIGDTVNAYKAGLSAAPTPPAEKPPIGWTDEEIEAMRKRGWEPAQCKICGEYAGARPAQPADRRPLTEEQILDIFREIATGNTIKLTRDVGPYEAAEVTHVSKELVRAIEAAHGIKGES